MGLDQFGVNLKDRVGRTIIYPKFNTPKNFAIEKTDVVDYMLDRIPPPYQHGDGNFQFSYEKSCLTMMLLLDFL